MPPLVTPVRTPGILCCEGPDDFEFFIWLRRHLSIGRETVEVEWMEGRTQLHNYLNGLPLRGEPERLKSLAIVCDADRDDGPTAFGRVRDDLRTTGYSTVAQPARFYPGPWAAGPSLSVGVFILPNNHSPGALEDLCLDSIGADPSLPCVDELLQCVSSRGVSWPEQFRSKARLNVWLGSRSDPRRRLREALRGSVFAADSLAFDQVRNFLKQLEAAASFPSGPSA